MKYVRIGAPALGILIGAEGETPAVWLVALLVSGIGAWDIPFGQKSYAPPPMREHVARLGVLVLVGGVAGARAQLSISAACVVVATLWAMLPDQHARIRMISATAASLAAIVPVLAGLPPQVFVPWAVGWILPFALVGGLIELVRRRTPQARKSGTEGSEKPSAPRSSAS